MGTDPYGRAIRDHHRGERTEPLRDVDGEETRDHPIERFYFEPADPESDRIRWTERWLDGPLLELGGGAGRDALYFQERRETVAIEPGEHLVETMCERGVADARVGDMFDLRAQFERDRFRSAHAHGTQVGLAGSLAGLRRFLSDLACVTTSDATAVLDAHDPEHDGAPDLLGYREDPAPGLGFRAYHFEYEDDVGPTLLFRLVSPERFREATVGTPWEIAAVERGDEFGAHYQVAVTKGRS